MKRALLTLGVAASVVLVASPAQAGPQPINFGPYTSQTQCTYAQRDQARAGWQIYNNCNTYTFPGRGWGFSAIPR